MTKWIVLVVLIISSVILGYFYIALKNMEANTETLKRVVAMQSLRVTHAFRNDTHQFTGELRLMNSCSIVSSAAVKDRRNPQMILISIVTQDQILEKPFCTKLPTRYPFVVTVAAPEGIAVAMTVNGKKVPVNVVDVPWQNISVLPITDNARTE